MKSILATMCFLVLAGCASQPPTVNPNEVSKDGLAKIDHSKLAMAYVRPGINWSKYTKIHFLPIQVTNDHPKGYRSPYIDRRAEGLDATYTIPEKDLQEMARELKKVDAQVFNDEQPYKLVNSDDEHTLLVQVIITDIRLTAPVEESRLSFQTEGETYSQNAGSMVFIGQVFDGKSKQVIAKAADRGQAIEQWQQNTKVFNLGEAQTVYRGWMNDFKNALLRTHANNSK